MTNKKNIFRFIGFIFASLIMYVVMLCIYGDNYSINSGNLLYQKRNHTITRFNEIKNNTDEVDILFLGSSHSFRSFDSRVYDSLGLKNCSLASQAQTPLQTEMLLKRYLDKVKPKLVVFEVNPHMFSIEGIESSIYLLSADEVDHNALNLVWKQKNIKVFNTFIYSIYNKLFTDDKSGIASISSDYEYHKGGFLSKKIRLYIPESFENNTYDFKKNQFDSFKNCISILKQNKTPFILIQAPITSTKYFSYSNRNEFDDRMLSYGDYYNTNNMLVLKDSLDFSDSHHLSMYGVKKFNTFFISEILYKYHTR